MHRSSGPCPRMHISLKPLPISLRLLRIQNVLGARKLSQMAQSNIVLSPLTCSSSASPAQPSSTALQSPDKLVDLLPEMQYGGWVSGCLQSQGLIRGDAFDVRLVEVPRWQPSAQNSRCLLGSFPTFPTPGSGEMRIEVDQSGDGISLGSLTMAHRGSCTWGKHRLS